MNSSQLHYYPSMLAPGERNFQPLLLSVGTFPLGSAVVTLLRHPPHTFVCPLCQVKLMVEEGVLFQIRVSARWEGGVTEAQTWDRNQDVLEYFSKSGPPVATGRFLDAIQTPQAKLTRCGASGSTSLLLSDHWTPLYSWRGNSVLGTWSGSHIIGTST